MLIWVFTSDLRAREKRLRNAAEQRRIKELRKKAQEDAEEERRIQVGSLLHRGLQPHLHPHIARRLCGMIVCPSTQLAREMFEKDRELAREREQAERRARIEAQMREEERLRKAEEHRLQTQQVCTLSDVVVCVLSSVAEACCAVLCCAVLCCARVQILQEQQALIKKKMEEMAEAERERLAKVRPTSSTGPPLKMCMSLSAFVTGRPRCMRSRGRTAGACGRGDEPSRSGWR
jgi:hypothetical protein